MAVPYGKRFPIEFNELFPQGAFIVGAVTPLTEYQSQDDRARNRPVRPRVDEASGLPFRPVVLEGLTVQPRAEASGQAKWISWVVRTTGMRAVQPVGKGAGDVRPAAA
jgi:hypothetical protein